MKLHSFFAILMMIVLGASFFVACGDINGGVSGNSGDNGSGTNDNGTNVTITETSISICITSYPDKVYYQVNEIFDPTGLVLSAVITERYPDGTEKNITEEIAYPNENISFSGTDFSTEGTKIITVIYTKSELVAYTSFEVTVGEGSLIEKTLDSISIKTLPTKTEYKVNEEFDPTGLEITANYTYYSDNSSMSYSNDISYDNNMTFSGTDFSTAGTKTITVTYTENETSKSATFEITVKSAAFSSTINYTKFDSELNADLSLYNGKAMTLYLDTTTVNIATLFTQFETLYDAVGENGSVSISYADAANTTIEGEYLDGLVMDLLWYPENTSKFNSFFNAIAPENATAESLPSISAEIVADGNLYGTDLDKFIEKYYTLGVADKLQGTSVVGSAEFDAIDYLNKKGGIAYDEANQYTGNYYNLDVNAALLMNANLKNVNVTGAVSGEKNTFEGTFTNVRFGEDTTGFTFSDSAAGIGLIEFAGDAPSQTPNVYSGRIIIQNAKSPITFGNGFSVDVSNLSEDAINNYVNQSTAGFVEAIYPTEATANSTKFTPSVIYAAGNLIKNTANDYSYATNQQWVKAANEDKWNEYCEKKYPNKDLLSKAKLDEKKIHC